MVNEVESLAREAKAPLTRLGRIGGKRLMLGDVIDVSVEELATAYRDGLPGALSGG